MKHAPAHPQHVVLEEIALTWLGGEMSWPAAVRDVYSRLGLDWPSKAEETELCMHAARMADTLTA